jgi:uncharacterized protein (TIGR00251 family)
LESTSGKQRMAHWFDCYEVEDGAVVVRVHVQPRAGRTAVVGRHGHALKLRVAAPPVDHRANDAVVALLADMVDIAPAAVTLVSGEKSRVKRFRLTGVDGDTMEQAIDVAIERPDEGRVRRR